MNMTINTRPDACMGSLLLCSRSDPYHRMFREVTFQDRNVRPGGQLRRT